MRRNILAYILVPLLLASCSNGDSQEKDRPPTQNTTSPPILTKPKGQTYSETVAIKPLRIDNSASGEITSCRSAPDLPNGLNVNVTADSSTCEITGRPSDVQPENSYIIYAVNAEGESETTVNITVQALVFTDTVSFPYDPSERLWIGLTISSGLVRLDWNDGTIPIDISPEHADSLVGFGSDNIFANESTQDSTAESLTLSFTDGIQSLIGFYSDSSSSSQFDPTPLTSATNLRALWCRGNCSVYDSVSALSDQHPLLEKLDIRDDELQGDIKDLPASIVDIFVMGAKLSGNINSLPESINTFEVWGMNTIDGDIGELPSSIQTIDIRGVNTLTGDIKNISPNMTHFSVEGKNTIRGNIKDLPSGLLKFSLRGNNTIAGEIQDIHNGLVGFVVDGVNTLEGDVAAIPASMNYIIIGGQNTVAGDVGDIPSSLSLLSIRGKNELSGDIGDIPDSIIDFYVDGHNTLNGDIHSISESTSQFVVGGNNTIEGDVKNLRGRIYHFELDGNNTLRGDVKDIANTIERFHVSGNNSLTGDIGGLHDSMWVLDIRGKNTVSGNLKGLPSTLRELYLDGENTVNGSISDLPTGFRNLHLDGRNTVSGNFIDIPRTIERFFLDGENTITGDLKPILIPTREFYLGGKNTVSGDIEDFPSYITDFYLGGNNTLSGNIGQLKNNAIRKFEVSGLNSIGFSTPAAWKPEGPLMLSLTGEGEGMSSSAVDAFLQHLNASLFKTEALGEIEIVRANDAPRTSESNDDVIELESKGYRIVTQNMRTLRPVSQDEIIGVWTYKEPSIGEYYFVFKDNIVIEYDYHGDVLDGGENCYGVFTNNYAPLDTGRFRFDDIQDDLREGPIEIAILINGEGELVWSVGNNLVRSGRSESDFVPECT